MKFLIGHKAFVSLCTTLLYSNDFRRINRYFVYTRVYVIISERNLRCKLWCKRGEGSENTYKKVQKRVLMKELY